MAKKNEIAKVDTTTIQPVEQIESLILTIRGKQVILDRDLARLYGVETRVLNQAVQRNIERFPEDFMFQLTKDEYENMSSQFVTTSPQKRPKSAVPYAFTENGIAMLSGVLRSPMVLHCVVPVKRLRRTENVRGTFEGVSAPRECGQPSPLPAHRTPYG